MIATIGRSALLVLLFAGCGSDASLDRTLATFERVRGSATLDGEPIARVARAAPSQALVVGDAGLVRLSLDSGGRFLLDHAAELAIVDEATVGLEAGRVYGEAGEGEELFLVAAGSTLRASDAAFSATAGSDGLHAYVVRGEVSWIRGEERGVARAGERLTISDAVSCEPVTLWQDWTGGLARPGPSDADGSRGVGMLEARVPDEVGQARWPLVVRRLDVRVHIVGDLAVTEVEQVFFNPASEMVEGLYRIRVPDEAVLQRFGVDRAGRLVDGYVREKAQAQAAYEAQVYRGSQLDPALLEWVAPGRYRARIYPIRPGETRRIVVRYAEWLSPIAEGGARLYRYPMGGGRDALRIQEVSISVDVAEAEVARMRAGMGAAVEQGRVRLRRSDFAPRADFWLELEGGPAADSGQRAWRAPHEPPPRAPDARTVVGEADERDYYYLPLRLPSHLFEHARVDGVDLVVVADVSAGTERAELELGRSVVEALTSQLGANDRVAIVSSDLTIRPLDEGSSALGSAEPARVESLLDHLARVPAGGATDLGQAVAAAASLLSPDRPGAVVYVGDGAPTVGELEAEGLLERIARLPDPLRLYAVGVGSEANLDLLEALTRGGGLAVRVEQRAAAADAALRVLGHATRPVAQRVTVDLGAGIENVYPRRPVDVVDGDVLSVVGRVRDQPPATVRVRGSIAGEPFEEEIAVTTGVTEASTDLRLRWAGERLRQLLLGGAAREEVAELGVRYGLITPFSSYYVPSAAELTRMGPMGLRWIDRPDLHQEAERARAVRQGQGWGSLFALALGPLAIAGCSSSEPEAASASMPMEVAPPWEATNGEGASTEVVADPAATAPTEIPPPADEAPPPPATPEPEPAVVDALIAPNAPAGSTAAPGQPRAAAPARAAPTSGAAAGRGQAFGGSRIAAMQQEAQTRRPRRRRRGGRSRQLNDPLAGLDGLDSSGLDVGRNEAETAAIEEDADGDFWARGGETERSSDASEALAMDLRLGTTSSGRVRFNTSTVAVTHHARRICSDAARASLDDRRELWRERLSAAGGPSGWVSVYRQAGRACETPSWRDRRALLSLILGAAGQVPRMVSVYRLFSSGAARGFLRAAILRRVRSPEDLRVARNAFGLGREPDWELVEQVLERARGPQAELRALRRLSMQYAESFELKLRLLEMLSTQGHEPEARRLADRLRADPRSDAGVRTAVGEMFIRLGQEEEARRVFSEIVEFAPLDELARRRLGDLYRAHGWFHDAYRQYQTLASIRPDDPTALLLLAQAAAGTGRIDEALRLEQRLMETSQPGEARGVARVAQLWTSVRLAKLRLVAREAGDESRLDALGRRLRRSGVLAAAGYLRATLVWSHPDAQLSLWAGHPGTGLARPTEIAPEYGIEAFDVPEQEDGAYRFEVRRADPDSATDMAAELVLVWHEGRDDETVRVVPLSFREGRAEYAWRLEGSTLTEDER